MALPHYKLQKQLVEKSTPEDFPFILVPPDSAPKVERLRGFLASKPLTIFLVLLFVASATALIWQFFDPQTVFSKELLKNPIVIASASTLIASLIILLILTSLKKKQTDFVASPMTLNLAETKKLSLAKVLEITPRPNTVIEWRCEQWDSAPFVEVLEETVIAELFSDEMVAPDHMVFSFEVEDKK